MVELDNETSEQILAKLQELENELKTVKGVLYFLGVLIVVMGFIG